MNLQPKTEQLLNELEALLNKTKEVKEMGIKVKVYDMTDEQLEEFEANMTFKDLLSLDDEELDEIDPCVVEEIVCEQSYDLVEDRIYYKELFNVPLDDEDEEYLRWAEKVDGDLGPPLM